MADARMFEMSTGGNNRSRSSGWQGDLGDEVVTILNGRREQIRRQEI